jgi:hypothetical protein
MVILIDSPAKYPKEPAPHQIAWQKLQKDWKSVPTDGTSQSIGSRLASSCSIIWWVLTKELRRLGLSFIESILRDPGRLSSRLDELGMPLHWTLVERLYAHAVDFYRLRPLDSRGILFPADPKDERPFRTLGASLGWDNFFTGGLEIIQVTGDHVTMMQPGPHNLMLAQEMTKFLNRSCVRTADPRGREH